MANELILIVDDSAETRAWLADSVLRPESYTIAEASTLAEARAQIAARAPQVIVLDAQLGEEDGFALLAEFNARFPIIVTTTHRSVEDMSAALDAGARDVLVKPFEPQRLSSSLAHTLRLTRSVRERDTLRELADRQAQEFNALYTVGKTINALLNIDEILTLVVSAAVTLVGAEQGSLMLLDGATGELYLRAQFNLSAKEAQKLRIKVTDTLIGRVVQTERPVMLSGSELLKVQTSLLVKSILAVPLVVGGHIIGVLTVDNQIATQAFTKHDVDLLSTLADSAAIAIENARLFAQAERERTQLETILRDIQDAVIVTDPQQRLLLLNPAAYQTFNLTDEIAGRFLSEITPLQPLLELFDRHSPEDPTPRAEIVLLDGRTLQGQLSPLNGVGYGVVLRDITRLKELDRIKSEFVAIVSHDLRTPLTAIRGYVSLLPRVGPLSPMQKDFVGRVERSMDNIVDLIADLLDIGKIEAGIDAEMTLVDLHTTVGGVVERLRPNAELHQHTLTLAAQPLPPVLGSTRRLEQVIANLVGNAIKYTPDGGQIAVSLVEDGEFLVFQVRDNGIGISREDQRRIFDKFYRVESEATENISGSGLGLSIVKAIVKKHAGRVWVDSELGKGSTFTVLLPKTVPSDE